MVSSLGMFVAAPSMRADAFVVQWMAAVQMCGLLPLAFHPDDTIGAVKAKLQQLTQLPAEIMILSARKVDMPAGAAPAAAAAGERGSRARSVFDDSDADEAAPALAPVGAGAGAGAAGAAAAGAAGGRGAAARARAEAAASVSPVTALHASLMLAAPLRQCSVWLHGVCCAVGSSAQ